MRPIKQTISDRGKGDCLRACVASLLHLDPQEVPNFTELGPEWVCHPENGLGAFLWRHGYEYSGICGGRKALERSAGVDGYFIACVPSVNFDGVTHAVIFKGTELAHDPTCLKRWEGTIDDTRYFFLIERREETDEK